MEANRLEIAKTIRLNPDSVYSEPLGIIKELKEDNGNCGCFNAPYTQGVMTTKAYVCIHFTQCDKCGAYSFRENQIRDFIKRAGEKTGEKLYNDKK